jgi:hypothetical protein
MLSLLNFLKMAFCRSLFNRATTPSKSILRINPRDEVALKFCIQRASTIVVILSERGSRRTLQPGGGESKDLRLLFNELLIHHAKVEKGFVSGHDFSRADIHPTVFRNQSTRLSRVLKLLSLKTNSAIIPPC